MYPYEWLYPIILLIFFAQSFFSFLSVLKINLMSTADTYLSAS